MEEEIKEGKEELFDAFGVFIWPLHWKKKNSMMILKLPPKTILEVSLLKGGCTRKPTSNFKDIKDDGPIFIRMVSFTTRRGQQGSLFLHILLINLGVKRGLYYEKANIAPSLTVVQLRCFFVFHPIYAIMFFQPL